MNHKTKRIKEKNTGRTKAIILSGIGILTVLGGTLAYFTTSTNIGNIFRTAHYQNRITETFNAPDNWVPGMTVEKKVEVENTGSIPMALRASYEEKWESANGKTLPLEVNGEKVSIISFNNNWTKNADGYYYYGSKENMTVLNPQEKSSSFINNVTLNSSIESKLKKTVSADGKTITYESTGDGYDNANYTLTIKIDTIQYDQAQSIW